MTISLSVLPKSVTNNLGFEEVGMLKYFVSEEERKASHNDQYWLPDSLYIWCTNHNLRR